MSLVQFKGQNHPQQVTTRGALDEVDDRGTHPSMFDPLNERFGFTLDVAAAPHNAKCERYFTRADNGLEQTWAGQRVWCNPPYSDLDAWVRKAWAEWNATPSGLLGALAASIGAEVRPAELIVMLVPANRPEQGWWQDHVEPHRDRKGSPLRVEFIRGRTRFIKPGQTAIGPNERPPFGCCLLIWDKENAR